MSLLRPASRAKQSLFVGDCFVASLLARLYANRIILVFDDLEEALWNTPVENDVRRDLIDSLTTLARSGPEAGIHLVVATKTLATKILPQELSVNLKTRAALKSATPRDSKASLGVSDAARLAGSGDGFFKSPGDALSGSRR